VSAGDAFVARLDAAPGAPPLTAAFPDAAGTLTDGPLEVAWRGADPVRPAPPGGAEEIAAGLRGPFAVLAWDGRHGVAARDPLGHRGLVHATRGRTLLLATDPRLLLPLLATRPAPDEVAVAHWLAGTGPPVGRTLFDGVERLAPGHLLPLELPARPRRFWHPRAGAPVHRDADEAATVLREAMAAAVDRSLAGAAGPGVLLSGGFDSGSVAVLAAVRGPVAYSAVFPGRPEVDESAEIASVRDAGGLAGVERRFTAGGGLGASLEFLLHHELPPASPNGFLWRPLLRRAAADGVTVVLDGEGGDEVLGFAPMLVADRLRRGDLPGAVRLARSVPGMGADPRTVWVLRALRKYGVRGAVPHRPHAALRRARRRPVDGDWLRPEVRALYDATSDPWAFKREAGPRWAAWLLDVVGRRAEALGAHDHFRREAELSGVELRHPLRDAELLETVLTIDPALHFDAHLDRPLARRAMAGALPDAVRLRTRKPDFNPLLRQALAVDRDAVGAVLGAGARVRAYLRGDVLDACLTEPPDRLRDRDLVTLWRAAALECWLRLDGERDALERLAAACPAPDDIYVPSTATVGS
jgi:asparagine synthase (glutamine-hydrolysing)